jgi:hypothetical protein
VTLSLEKAPEGNGLCFQTLPRHVKFWEPSFGTWLTAYEAQGQPSAMSELRRQPRKAIKVEFLCQDASGAGELVFDSSDLSTGGAFLVSDVLFEQGDMLGMECHLPNGPTLQCEARVAWVRRFPATGQKAGMGIEFVGLAESARAALAVFLD